MAWWQTGILAIYTVSLILLMMVSFHRYVMVRLYHKYKEKKTTAPTDFIELPTITVQLPVYNERYVVGRLIRAVGAFDYPKELLEVQILDDSDDDTTQIAAQYVHDLRVAGVDVTHIHRDDRVGYKAGALAYGLRVAKGEFVAVFDADFVPPPDFLKKTIHHFANKKVGLVQARWCHLNRDYSLLTRVQAIYLDGHFVMEHGARSRAGLLFNFNGTAGVWRKDCIHDAGGWSHDTLTEDLDLSYRAQLRGWQFVYLQDVVTPAEIPVEVNAWKTQQFRWAKGSVQTAKKLLRRVLRSDLPWSVKGEAAFHLLTNFSYLLMACVAMLIFPAIILREDLGWYRVLLVDFPLFVGATGVISRFYISAQKEIYTDWKSRLKYLPAVLAFGMGISLNNARGVIQALMGYDSAFCRTPKYQVINKYDQWLDKGYGLKRNLMSFLELGMGFYLVLALLYSLAKGLYFPIPFLGLFASGFFYVGLMSLWQGRQRQKRALTPIEAIPAD